MTKKQARKRDRDRPREPFTDLQGLARALRIEQGRKVLREAAEARRGRRHRT